MKLNYSAFEEKMKKSLAALGENLDTIRASQANPAVLAKISFEYYGAPTPVNTMADIRCADSKTLTITPKVLSRPFIIGNLVIRDVIPLTNPRANLKRRKTKIMLITFMATSVIPSEIFIKRSSIVVTSYFINIWLRFSIGEPL